MICGIDFSIKSTAITVKHAIGYEFFSFARSNVAKDYVFEDLKKAGVIVKTIPDEPLLPKKSLTAVRERSSLIDMNNIIDNIILNIKQYNIQSYAIEGFSFGSTGNRLAQISGYQWVLRWELQKLGILPENFWTFAPMSVKVTAGKGNFSKEQMIEAFINTEDELLNSHPFWLTLKNNPEVFQNKKGLFIKPIDDIIDSWWVLKTLEKTINT